MQYEPTFFLTADHCFNPPGLPQQNVSNWRFTFQAWSSTCTPSQNSSGITYNGSTLRANWSPSDFCLVELNNTPPSNSNINYAGWSRSTAAPSSGTAIHHPHGDVMKISRDNNTLTLGTFPGKPTNYHWRVDWSSQTNGSGQTVTPVTEPGSSGSPLFDQNHRIVGQLSGGPSVCGGTSLWDFYGRFDLSWTGGGTSSTRLSDWLDPNNTGAIATNTTNTSTLSPTINGDLLVCTTSNSYTINNLLAGATVQWQATPSGIVSINSPNSSQTTLTRIADGEVELTAAITACGYIMNAKTNIKVGAPSPIESLTIDGVDPTTTTLCRNTESMLTAYPGVIEANVSYVWDLPLDWVSLETGTNTATTQDYILPVYPGGDGWVYVRRQNQCGYSSLYSVYVSFDPWCGNFYTVSPNPATGNITIDGQKQKKNIKEVQIIDKTGQVRKVVKFGNNVKRVNLNISGLAPDIYYIKIFDGKEWKSKPIVVH